MSGAIELTDEMLAAFNGADFSGCGNADWEDSHLRVGLAAVLAIVERDYVVRPAVHRVNERRRTAERCLRAGPLGVACRLQEGHDGMHRVGGVEWGPA